MIVFGWYLHDVYYKLIGTNQKSHRMTFQCAFVINECTRGIVQSLGAY